MSTENGTSDDFCSYGAIPVEVTYTGCGGEFCPGPIVAGFDPVAWFGGDGTPFLCAACRTGTRHVTTELRPDTAPRG